MNIFYNRLFNLVVGHDFFVDGYAGNVQIYPSTETQSLLRNGKMLFKTLQHGITILYNTNDDELTPFIGLCPDQRFVFVIKLDNSPEFLNITDLDESSSRKYSSHKLVYFTNDPASVSSDPAHPEVITHKLIDSLWPKLFTYGFSLAGNPAEVLLDLIDENGSSVSIGKTTEGEPLPSPIPVLINKSYSYSRQIDLRDKPAGRYTIKIINSAGTITLREEEIYIDDTLAAQNIFGIADIRYDNSSAHLYGDTEEYKLHFKRAESLWKYVAINKNKNIDFETDELEIIDSGGLNGTPYVNNTFERAYARISLTAIAPGTSGNAITLAYEGAGDYPAIELSGKTLRGGSSGIAASGALTIINISITSYKVTINGEEFIEGTDFNNGTTPALTAQSLVSAINAGSAGVSASLLAYDSLVNGFQAQVFRSTIPIPFYEKPKTALQLKKKLETSKLIPNLPNPSRGGNRKSFGGEPESEVYVFI